MGLGGLVEDAFDVGYARMWTGVAVLEFIEVAGWLAVGLCVRAVGLYAAVHRRTEKKECSVEISECHGADI